MSKKRLLWLSDSPRLAHVGQSCVGRECLKLLQEFYEVEALGFGDSETSKPIEVPYNVISCSRTDVLNSDKMVEYIKQSNPDLFLFSHDPFLLPSIGDIRSKLPNVKYFSWLTVDGEPSFWRWRDFIKPYHKCVFPTKFSEKAVLDRWLDINSDVVPYGCNHSIFHPPAQGKDELKKSLHQESQGAFPMGNRFIAFYVGANQDRKNLGLIHESWREFEKGKENNVLLVMLTHSASLKEEIGSYDLFTFVQDTKTLVVNIVPQPVETIGRIMAASDVLIHPSTGEGFGLSVMEAMASGTVPIIVPYAGVTDFCNESNSYCIPFIKFVGGYHAHRAIASVEDTVKQLESAYQDKEERSKKAQNAIETASKFTWEKTVDGLHRNIDEVLGYSKTNIHVKRIV